MTTVPNSEEIAKSLLKTNDKYLRNRPFLVVNIIHRAAKGVHTQKKGWAEVEGNMATYEQPSLVDRVNDTHLRNASVIIDVMKSKCVKNSFSDTNSDDVVRHYLEKYRAQITEAIQIWLGEAAKKVAEQQKSVDAVYTAN